LVTVYIYREKIRKNKKHKKYGVTGVTGVTFFCNPYSATITEDTKGNTSGNTSQTKVLPKEMALKGVRGPFSKKNIFALYK